MVYFERSEFWHRTGRSYDYRMACCRRGSPATALVLTGHRFDAREEHSDPGHDEHARLEALGGPDEFAALLGITPATAEETLYVTECPWELVRSCTEDYSFTLYNKHTGDACRDYRAAQLLRRRASQGLWDLRSCRGTASRTEARGDGVRDQPCKHEYRPVPSIYSSARPEPDRSPICRDYACMISSFVRARPWARPQTQTLSC